MREEHYKAQSNPLLHDETHAYAFCLVFVVVLCQGIVKLNFLL